MTKTEPSGDHADRTTADLVEEIRILKAENAALRRQLPGPELLGGAFNVSLKTLSEAVEGILDGFALYDADDRLVFCNEAYRQGDGVDLSGLLRFGVTFEEVLLARVKSGEARGVMQRSEEWIRRRLAQHRRGGVHTIQVTTPLGERRTVQLNEYKTRDGSTVVVRINISDRVRTEEALRESERIFRSIFENTDVGMTVVSRDRGIRLFNPALCRILGYTPEEFGSFMLRDLVHPDDADKNIRRLVSDRVSSREYDKRFRHKEGHYAVCHVTSSAVADDRGNVQYVVSIFRDLTASQLIEQQLRQSQKMEAIGQLTGGVAHDFNNILSVILMNLQLAGAHLGGDHAVARHLDAAAKAALRGSGLTRHLLAFSRQQMLQPTVLEIDAVVDGMVDMLRRTIGEAIEISVDLADGLWPLMTDQHELETAILNLVLNARDAMPEGGTLRIEAGNVELGVVDAARPLDVAPGRYVILTVGDTGVGMTERVMESAFEPFFSTKEVGKGTGLGLSMVYGFMKQSQGHVALESAPGRGTTVRLYFPAWDGVANEAPQPAATDPTANPPAEPERLIPERLLIVEDEPAVRESLMVVLSGLGYSVFEAENAEAALGVLAREAPIDLILSDVVMPGRMDGLALSRAARERHPGIRILLMSGYMDRQRGDWTGLGETVDLIAKPFANADLARRIRGLLGERSADVAKVS